MEPLYLTNWIVKQEVLCYLQELIGFRHQNLQRRWALLLSLFFYIKLLLLRLNTKVVESAIWILTKLVALFRPISILEVLNTKILDISTGIQITNKTRILSKNVCKCTARLSFHTYWYRQYEQFSSIVSILHKSAWVSRDCKSFKTTFFHMILGLFVLF